MKQFRPEYTSGWNVLGGTERSQAAVMVLGPGAKTGGPDNRHTGSDQWMLVTAGQGEAIIGSKHVELKKDTLLLIEAGEAHEIRNGGNASLETLNFYAPKEY